MTARGMQLVEDKLAVAGEATDAAGMLLGQYATYPETMADSVIAEAEGVHRSTVWRRRKKQLADPEARLSGTRIRKRNEHMDPAVDSFWNQRSKSKRTGSRLRRKRPQTYEDRGSSEEEDEEEEDYNEDDEDDDDEEEEDNDLYSSDAAVSSKRPRHASDADRTHQPDNCDAEQDNGDHDKGNHDDQQNEALVGRGICVLMDQKTDLWFCGTIRKYDSVTGYHLVAYDDGLQVEENLNVDAVTWIIETEDAHSGRIEADRQTG